MLISPGKDPDGDEFDLSGVVVDRFLQSGVIVNRCSSPISLNDVIGSPRGIEKSEEGIKLTSEVANPYYIAMFDAMVESGKLHPEFGYALSGVITGREGGVIRCFDLKSVALLPLKDISDPRCVVRVVQDSQGRVVKRSESGDKKG